MVNVCAIYHGYEWWCFQQICGDWCLHYSGTALVVQLRTTNGQSAWESAGPEAGDVREKNAPPAGSRRDFGAAMEPKFACSTPRTMKDWKKQIVLLQHLASPWKKSSTSPMICLCPNGLSKRSCLPKPILSARHLLRRAPTAIFAVKQRRILVFIFLFLVNFRESLTSSKSQEMFVYIYI